ncbi:hypothetical protein A1Q1_00227 [Trichosporon asahii var. asahii CBS 2479]|uniref:Uncharacterized protein n=1 Tax=Trichosporon asahii var. asahii (strain ATCC 90039 / CBS 2479 / JCM 2466 / KCTC 7840 / NBRC 103889/ NCYC 2677 / UAMH 7654) TaxID=1186058 RepID=J6F0J5_TRIAS|nr:hypothetical protein A1Q1_00227 [Trichosporon asahii var. asahii CBS 2479]EJT50459.1 hypothetical protein A1Q1_00227 [Trichosporon asahii var. asahii CBS 2479]
MPPRFARRTSRDSARSALSTASQETFATALASPPTSTPFVSPALSTPFATPFTPSLSPLPTAGYFDPDPQPQPQSQSEWVEFNPEDLKVGSPAGFEYTWLLHSETSSAYDTEDERGEVRRGRVSELSVFSVAQSSILYELEPIRQMRSLSRGKEVYMQISYLLPPA